MTWQSRGVSLLPLILLLVITASVLQCLLFFSISTFGVLIGSIYLLPVALYRLHNLIAPLKEGVSNLSDPRYSSWWGGHQIQLIYTIIPFFEQVLRVVPGVYSAWLRLWGSTVGKEVYWTPQVEIYDRGLLVIGNKVIFGNKVECYGHVIKPKSDGVRLYVKPIVIGDNVFLGAGSRLGPGATIAEGTFVPLLTDVMVNARRDKA